MIFPSRVTWRAKAVLKIIVYLIPTAIPTSDLLAILGQARVGVKTGRESMRTRRGPKRQIGS